MYSYELARPEGITDAQWDGYVKRAMRTLRALTPVKTGNLRDGWELGDQSSDSAVFVNEVPYAEYVNDGTPRMTARNMTGKMQASMNPRLTLGTLAGF